MNNILHAKALATIFGATEEIKQEVNISFFYQYNHYSRLIEVEEVTITDHLNFQPSDLNQDLTVAIAAILIEKERDIVMCSKSKINYYVKTIVPLDYSYNTNMLFV